MLQTKEQTSDTPLRESLETVASVAPKWTKDAYGNNFAWLHLGHPGELRQVAEKLAGKVRLCTITAYAEERDDTDKRRRIAYHFSSGNIVLTVTVPLYEAETLRKLPVPSITPWFRNADWNEREFREMFNIDIEGHPNPARLFLDERLDAGVMTKLIPFSAMANSAGTNTLWERILEAKGVPPEERLPSLAVPSEPVKTQPAFTPVAPAQPLEPSLATPTLANLAKSAEEASRGSGRKPAPDSPAKPKPEQAASGVASAAKADTPAAKPETVKPESSDTVAAAKPTASAAQKTEAAPPKDTPAGDASKASRADVVVASSTIPAVKQENIPAEKKEALPATKQESVPANKPEAPLAKMDSPAAPNNSGTKGNARQTPKAGGPVLKVEFGTPQREFSSEPEHKAGAATKAASASEGTSVSEKKASATPAKKGSDGPAALKTKVSGKGKGKRRK